MGVYFIVYFGFMVSGLILAIVALSSVQKLRREVEELKASLRGSNATPVAKPPVETPLLQAATKPPEPSRPAPPPLPTADAVRRKETRTEIQLGSKLASIVGIIAVVIGMVLFVGYAIREGWLGPAFRIALGMATGVGLIIGGSRFHAKGAQFGAMTRALTGGGLALLFMSVFAAYGTYHLIGRGLTGVGLVGCALAAVVLALRYDSQAVAILGLLGAFAMPVMLEADFGESVFPLVYVAAVNVPVLLLGQRKGWGWLVHLAFGATWVLAMAGAAANSLNDWPSYVTMMIVYHLQFASLNVVRAKPGVPASGRWLDVARLQVSTLLLVFLWTGMRAAAEGDEGLDTLLGVLAAAHALGAVFFHKRLGAFRDEVASLASSSVALLAAAIGVETRGFWLAVEWAALGLATTWLSTRVRSVVLHLAGAGLGLLAWSASLMRLGEGSPLVNEPFATAVVCAVALGLHAVLHRRAATGWPVPVGIAFVVATVLTVTLDVARIDHWGVMLVSYWWAGAALLLVVSGLAWKRGYMRVTGMLLFVMAIVKVFVFDLAELRGMPRIAAFMGLGILLLVLSYAYQRVAPRFLDTKEPAA